MSTRFGRRGARHAASACALLMVAACTASEAAVPAAPAPYEPHPAAAIVDRLAGSEDAVPVLEGLSVDAASARLAALDLRAQVVAFDVGPVSAQYPEPGARSPADGLVVLWTGTPPEPPPPPAPEPTPEAPPADPPAPAAEAEDEATGVEAEEEPAPAATGPAPTPTATPAQPSSGGGQASHPPRTSPRRMDPTESGTVLEGRASWYGPGFAGRTTACGDRFDPGALTLASRELRCGTRVQITGPSGRTVEAVVNDWGPAEWTGRRFDLSRATFETIHPLSAGVVAVTVEVLP